MYSLQISFHEKKKKTSTTTTNKTKIVAEKAPLLLSFFSHVSGFLVHSHD